LDTIHLRVLWNHLISIANEQARALRRTAFSPIVREAGDLAVGILDARGRLVANAVTGTPGHINTLRNAGANFIARFPVDTLEPGDQLITNDPWLGSAHFFDVIVLSPIFYKGKVIGFIGTSIHHTDIGGYGLGAGARDVHEEGLWIPILKLYEAGRPNSTLFDMIRCNVREPKHVVGDLAAQVSAGRTGADRIVELCGQYGLEDLQALSDAIIDRSEEVTRAAIRKLKSGTYRGETTFDVPGGDKIVIKAAVSIDAEKGETTTDFSGTSPPSALGINVCLDYTIAYNSFALHCCLTPEIPNNQGSLAPFHVVPPKNSILNAQYPSPLNARHVVGMYVPIAVMKGLYHVVPDAVLAESAAGIWSAQVSGKDGKGKSFVSSMFTYAGGMGARAGKHGLSATGYPAGISTVPMEALEAEVPIVFDRKELLRGTGGKGRNRGGDGQIIKFHVRSRQPWLLNAIISRTSCESEGIAGGGAGSVGKFLVNGKQVRTAGKLTLQPKDVVVFETPGGGGYGAAPKQTGDRPQKASSRAAKKRPARKAGRGRSK
jgi:N-methylhydantoinase B/oxoprolinase/acetone carboxylase alpha subunit